MASRHAAIFASTATGSVALFHLIRRCRHPHNCESQFEVGTLDEP